MKKTNKKILIIGGLGHWSNKTYLPALNDKFCLNKPIICDIIDSNLKDYIKLDKFNFKKNISIIKSAIDKFGIDVVIITTPPEYHHIYLKGLLGKEVDIICDKPLIAFNDMKNILKEYYYIKKHKTKKIYSPLRRQVQSFYKKLYEEIERVHKNFGQNVKFVSYYENDGVHRWDCEMEIDFCHGYASGLGKLSHTGYHIIDVVRTIITKGCSNIKNLECEILDKNLVGDNCNSKSNQILKKLLGLNIDTSSKLKDKTKQAELDITVKYTINFFEDNPSYIYLHLRHSGISQREIPLYDDKNTGDQGRTDNSVFFVEQGALQNIFGAVFADSSSSGSKGNSYLTIKRHFKCAELLKKDVVEFYNVDNSQELQNVEIIRELILATENNELEKKYKNIEFDSEELTMELFVASLIAKMDNKKIIWEIGKLYDNLH